jgi:hypothetical protein
VRPPVKASRRGRGEKKEKNAGKERKEISRAFTVCVAK